MPRAVLRLVQPRLRAPPRATRAWSRASCARALPHLRGHRRRRWSAAVRRLPTSFVPAEDQGNMPRQRAAAAGRHAEPHAGGDAAGRGHAGAARGAEHGLGAGLQLRGQRPERRPGLRHAEGLERAQRRRPFGVGGRARFGALGKIRDAIIFRSARRRSRPGHAPTASRCACRTAAATATRRCWRRATSCWAGAGKSPLLVAVRPDGLEDARSCSSTSTATRRRRWAWLRRDQQPRCPPRSARRYVNDFPNAGRVQRVVVQADAPTRMQPDDLLRLNALNSAAAGAAGGLRQHALDHRRRCSRCATTATRPCASPASRRPASGSGAAIDEMERLAPRSCRPGSPTTVDRPVARGDRRLDGADPVRLLAAVGVPVPGGAVRELVDPASR